MPTLSEYLQIKQAAAYLGVCPKTLRNWEAAGKIIVHRHPVNNYRLFKRLDLEQILSRIAESRTQLSRSGNARFRSAKPR